MTRAVIGGLIGGFLLYLVGFIFWGTPLAGIPFSQADETRSAAVQSALAQNLTETGTGSYIIPSLGTPGGTTLFGQGPIATVHFNTGGFPAMDTNSLIQGFVLALIVGVVMAFALRAAGGAGSTFGERGKVAVLYALAITLWSILGQPVFNHYGWTYWVYAFVADFIGLTMCGLVIARWFVVDGRVESAPAADYVPPDL